MQRASYQQGNGLRKPRSRGPDVWVFRYMDGETQRSEILGTIIKFKTKSAARKEADRKLLEINERLDGIKVSGLCDRFTRECDKGTPSSGRIRSTPTSHSRDGFAPI